jgi:hypothetical protein
VFFHGDQDQRRSRESGSPEILQTGFPPTRE